MSGLPAATVTFVCFLFAFVANGGCAAADALLQYIGLF